MPPGLAIEGHLEARGPSGCIQVVGRDDRVVLDLPRLSDGLYLLIAGHRPGRRVHTGASRLVTLISGLRRAVLRLELRCRGRRFASLGTGFLPVAIHWTGLARTLATSGHRRADSVRHD